MISGLSKWKISQAMLQRKEPGQSVVSPDLKRARLDSVKKINHLVNFIDAANFIQDDAHGTKELKLDPEEKITIPNLMRTMTPSNQAIHFLLSKRGQRTTEKRKELSVGNDLYWGDTKISTHFKDQVESTSVRKKMHPTSNSARSKNLVFSDQIGKLQTNKVSGNPASLILMNNRSNDNFKPFRYNFGRKFCNPS